MQARWSKARGEDAEAPAFTEEQQRALEAIRRQLDTEFGGGEHPGRSPRDVRPRRRPPARRSRRGGGMAALIVAGFALGSAAGGLATALYLKADPAPASGRPESPPRADRTAPAESPPTQPSLTGHPVPAPDDVTTPPASSPPEPAVSAGGTQAEPDVQKPRLPSVRSVETPSLPPRTPRPAPARPRSRSEPGASWDIQSR